MTHEEALELLQSQSSLLRRNAALYLASHATEADIPKLARARQIESDTYTLRRLDQALSRFITTEYGRETEQATDDASIDSATFAKAIEWVGRLVLHEMEGPIGRVALYASSEVGNYEASKTKAELEGLRQIFSGLTVLIEASRIPRRTDFDLSDLIQEIVDSEAGDVVDVSLHGAKPFIIEADPSLVRLALANGVKNAVEAVVENGASNAEHPIIVTWGKSDKDYWISVIDSGPGIKGVVEDKFKTGLTSKRGHLGFGLAIAKRAMDSLNGTVSLESQSSGGASYELRWIIN